MANEFLLSKWKLWYKALDVNRDGTLSQEDADESKKMFSESHNFDADKRKQVLENMEQWWQDYIFRGKSGDLSESEFVEALNKEFKADKEKFNAEMTECFGKIFDVVDTSKNKLISKEEFLIAFKAYGHGDEAWATGLFKVYNPDNNVIPLQAIVESWVDFTTSEDKSKPCIIKAAFEEVV